MTSPTERFLPLLLAGDTDASEELFGGSPHVDDVMSGHVTDMHYFWAAARHMWLAERQARLEPVRTTRQGARAVVEVVLHLRDVALPVAVVGEEDGEQLTRARLYHSTWPLTGGHAVRSPLLARDPELRAPDIVGVYQEALARGDVEAVLATLEEDAVVREPAGGAYAHATPEARRGFYQAILKRGGIPLDHCVITDDGTACALEYVVVRWGETNLEPQAGIAVYERGAGGRLRAARIYDDVSPPE